MATCAPLSNFLFVTEDVLQENITNDNTAKNNIFFILFDLRFKLTQRYTWNTLLTFQYFSDLFQY
jgi:hypothetical protein